MLIIGMWTSIISLDTVLLVLALSFVGMNLQVLHKMSEERGHVSDIIRQEFADRIVATEEENKRIKNEIAELRAKHRIELDRAKAEIEDIKKAKDEEMEEVHKR